MNNTTSKVYTPIIVKEPAPPVYRPSVEPEVVLSEIYQKIRNEFTE